MGFNGLGLIGRLITATWKEHHDEAECREELLEERSKALKNAKECSEVAKRHGSAFCSYNELQDDDIFREKLIDCHKKHSLFRWSLRGQ